MKVPNQLFCALSARLEIFLSIQMLLLAGVAGAAPASDEGWERFPDGSVGQVTTFRGVDGTTIPAYIRKPSGAGPFPVVLLLHGGGYGAAATYGLGRSTNSPTEDFIKESWAVYSIDYRPTEGIKLLPIEYDDTVEAVKTVRGMSFVDPKRVGMLGGSHGGNVISRVISRVDLEGAILCAPAALDLIAVKKAAEGGEPVVGVLKKMIAEMETKFGAKAEEIEKDPAKFGYSSAMTEVAGVRCPILIINGRNDDNSPVSVIDAYVKNLRAAGKQAETYMPDNGPHGFYFGRPNIPESKEAARRAVAFFKQRFAEQAGGGHFTTGQIYTTTFDGDEDPLSESGKWINNGLDWTKIRKSGGIAYGTQTGVNKGIYVYDDSYAHLSGFPPDQEAWGEVHIAKPNPSCNQELEILLRWTSSAHSTTGYECFARCISSESSYLEIVRWDGPLGKFTYLARKRGPDYGLKNGDTLKASIVGNVITVYINGVEKAQAKDDTYKTGNPGIGVFLQCRDGRGMASNTDFGFTSFTARGIAGK
jgi:acetyl esterase/lipase